MPHIANATAETEAEEVEITPEMIRAGMRIYLLGIDDPPAAVECIFSAMHAAMNRAREDNKTCSSMAKQTTSSQSIRVTYKVVKTGGGKTEVTVTSGKLAGKTARIITTSPSAAYFSEAPVRRTSGA